MNSKPVLRKVPCGRLCGEGGAVYHAESKTWTGLSDASSCALMVKEWMNLGADMIGGCCGIGPEQIKAMGKIMYE